MPSDDEAWYQPAPACPVHGAMRYDPVMSRWGCAGFDGEGCDQRVTDEELAASWRPLGTVDPATLVLGEAWPDGASVTPWADPWHDVAADLRALRDDRGGPVLPGSTIRLCQRNGTTLPTPRVRI